jgi:acetate kinase
MNTHIVTTILCLNSGSSSLKTAAFDTDLHELGRVGTAGVGSGALTDVLHQLDIASPDIVVHRIVHGGPHHDRPCVVDADLIDELDTLTPLAPLHLPPALELVRASFDRFPVAVHVACFDTAFHHDLPEVARRYALPDMEETRHVRRYGFHGLSCEHVVTSLEPGKTKRLVIAHLGAGCSVTAVSDGKSIDTSMGFTPAGGVPMATRPGDLDPGLLIYLLRNGLDVDQLAHIINFESGLTALAGTGDMKSLLERNDAEADLAMDLFCMRVAQQIGAYAVTLDGLDALAFTGGIGEHAPTVRELIVQKLQILQPFDTFVIPTNEELVMARHAASFLPLRHL